MSNDTKNYPEDSFENMKIFQKNNFNFPYLIDENSRNREEIWRCMYSRFFGYNRNLGLQYRGRFRELKI